jgi:hypothetical protein
MMTVLRIAVYSETIIQLIDGSVERMLDSMRQGAPHVAGRAESWIEELAGTERPGDYFRHPLAFPMLLLPWWMEQTVRATPDLDFQADLIYSSINGYYYIRMVDNVMDGHSTVERQLLPMLGLFHMHFHGVYHAYFAPGHPFWQLFRSVCLQSAESAVRDAGLRQIDLTAFESIAGTKVVGGKIPLAAVSYRYGQPELFERWQPFYDKLGCWHQMYNDLFGWLKDLRNQTPSYFLSEAGRRKAPEQSLAEWVIRAGFHWGVELLNRWLEELHRLATVLDSPALTLYLHQRQTLLHEQSVKVAHTLHSLGRLMGEQEGDEG